MWEGGGWPELRKIVQGHSPRIPFRKMPASFLRAPPCLCCPQLRGVRAGTATGLPATLMCYLILKLLLGSLKRFVMLHKMKFIIKVITAPGPKIKQNYNHTDVKGKLGSHMHLKHCQVSRGWAGARAGGSHPAPSTGTTAPGTMNPAPPGPLPRTPLPGERWGDVSGRTRLLLVSHRPSALGCLSHSIGCLAPGPSLPGGFLIPSQCASVSSRLPP